MSSGAGNSADLQMSTVTGGRQNKAEALVSTVTGGADNRAASPFSAVGGGDQNLVRLSLLSSFLLLIPGPLLLSAPPAGVLLPCVSPFFPSFPIPGPVAPSQAGATSAQGCITVGGGCSNSALLSYATVVGGVSNTASGYNSTVVGGRQNHALKVP